MFIITFFTLLSLSTVFGAVLLWRAGALNYAWSLALCLVHFVVYRFYYAGINSWYENANLFVVGLFCILSFAAGMSSFDLGAIGCLIHLAILLYRKYTRQTTQVRFVFPIIFYIAGFLALYTAPGTSIRAQGVEDYVSLGQIITWLYTFELTTFTSHYLNTIGKSMYKTNYFIALASIACTYFVFKLQSQYRFMPVTSKQWVMGYITVLATLLALLLSNQVKPSGDAFGATILFANFLVSCTALVFLLSFNNDMQQRSTAIMLVFLHCILIVDVSAYSVGVLPARRAYFTASVLCAFILSIFVQLTWKPRIRAYVFIPLFILSASIVSLETIGLRITEHALVTKPLSKLTSSDDMMISQEYKFLKSPQFYDWGTFSTDESDFANRCFAQYQGINSVTQLQPTQHVPLIDYIQYLITLQKTMPQ
ncbi:hypothetical protein VH1807_contig00019-0039 [Vibrio harveyi]|nr:hypothetical protein VH1807_contig00019-0039 [Vibrio harveyi]